MNGYGRLYQQSEPVSKIFDTHRIRLEKEIAEILTSKHATVEQMLALMKEFGGICYHSGYTEAYDKAMLRVRKLNAMLEQSKQDLKEAKEIEQ